MVLSPVAGIVLAALLGLLIGSFLNVVIHRLPRMLERQWAAECASLEGRSAPEAPPTTCCARARPARIAAT